MKMNELGSGGRTKGLSVKGETAPTSLEESLNKSLLYGVCV